MSVPGRPVYDLAEQVTTREDFVAFVEALRVDLRDQGADWESTTLDDYLEALGGYVEGLGPSLEEIVQEREPLSGEPEPSWRLFACILLLASFYE
jgi:hypothetical protein